MRGDEQRAVAPFCHRGAHFRHRPLIVFARPGVPSVQEGRHRHVDPVERALYRTPENSLAQLVATVQEATDLGVDPRHRRLSPPVVSTRPLFAERSIASTTSTERSPTL